MPLTTSGPIVWVRLCNSPCRRVLIFCVERILLLSAIALSLLVFFKVVSPKNCKASHQSLKRRPIVTTRIRIHYGCNDINGTTVHLVEGEGHKTRIYVEDISRAGKHSQVIKYYRVVNVLDNESEDIE
ncbi:DgyrCDS3955 [Dimorphilus gyrociliatus]|uniref:DgyrCDS3955 n=1 Tax=Dimorphilus gyrociliatus TaxID=2664684 RepID=A0A7I8VHL8_9ANNE|nr:DgyrCDS3955 [Dimorphilus gyrociliatus]